MTNSEAAKILMTSKLILGDMPDYYIEALARAVVALNTLDAIKDKLGVKENKDV